LAAFGAGTAGCTALLPVSADGALSAADGSGVDPDDVVPVTEGVVTAGVLTVLRPGWALAATAANRPAQAIPAAPIQRVIRETRARPWSLEMRFMQPLSTSPLRLS
jgi:hypothetical protein